ncbi:MAG: NAD(P)-binding domain-containing protein [Leptospirales bacterium]|nr:NAD(P)-binding domain-containing protein [Leptospirales bacterium]
MALEGRALLDAVIVGAGPIGIEMAAALKREGLSYVQIERGYLGQTIFNYPPDTRFFSSPERIAIAGIPLLTLDQNKATREEYLTYLRSVVVQLQLNINFSESVESISKDKGTFTVRTKHAQTGNEAQYQARNVILAIGDMHKYRMLGIPGEERSNVSHAMRDPHTYLGQRVLIVGGKNSAAEAAIRLYRVGAHVSLSYRKAELPSESIKYWILPELKALINSGMIKFYPSSNVTEIGADRASLATEQGAVTIALDYALLLTGYVMDPWLYKLCGIKTSPENDQPQWKADTMETNVPGIYVAGTAAAGTQKPYRYFIENCHEHVERIVAAITGKPASGFRRFFELPES